jgi:hypothetical protein
MKAYYTSHGVTGDAHTAPFLANMAVIIAIYGLCFAANIFTLVVKYKTGSLWLFRTRSTLHGSLITVNTTALFTVWASIFTLSSTVCLNDTLSRV